MTRSINVIAPFSVHKAYGSLSEYIALGFKYSDKMEVHPFPINWDLDGWIKEHGLSAQFQRMWAKGMLDQNAPSYLHFVPDPSITAFAPENTFKIYHTVYESDTLPNGWAQVLNGTPGVIVPSNFLIDTFKNSGVTSDIHVIPEGIDPMVYHLRYREIKPNLVVGTVGPVTQRKNTRELITGWKRAFENDPKASLVIKGSYPPFPYDPDDERISHQHEPSKVRGIVDFYNSISVLLAMGSEGFGMPLVEALACGCPVIAFDSEGQADICKELGDLILTVPHKGYKEEYDYKTAGLVGHHNVPDPQDICDALIEFKENQQHWVNQARKASEWIIQNRNIWKFSTQVVKIMEGYGAYEKP